MTHLLPALITGLMAAWGAGMSWLFREARTVLRHVPAAVGELLRSGHYQDELVRLVTQVATFANLTKEERRLRAIDAVGHWLENHGIRLTDSELAVLVELLYSFVKRHQPDAIAPEPEFSS